MESDGTKSVNDPLIIPVFWDDERPALDWFQVQWIIVERYLQGFR